MGAIEFEVVGDPVPQGSKTGFVVGGRAVVTDQNRKTLKPWRALVAAEAGLAHQGEQLQGAVEVLVEFRIRRPKSVRRTWPSVKPDVDKLLRALLDGISDSAIWRDDAQVVRVTASKVYAERPGATVRIAEL